MNCSPRSLPLGVAVGRCRGHDEEVLHFLEYGAVECMERVLRQSSEIDLVGVEFPADHFTKEFFLAGKMVVKRPFGHSHSLGDVLDRHGVVASLKEELRGSFQDGVFRVAHDPPNIPIVQYDQMYPETQGKSTLIRSRPGEHKKGPQSPAALVAS